MSKQKVRICIDLYYKETEDEPKKKAFVLGQKIRERQYDRATPEHNVQTVAISSVDEISQEEYAEEITP